MKLIIAGSSDVGKVRNVNEDCYSIIDQENFAVVCDGMGGHAAGDVASKLAVETVGKILGYSGGSDLKKLSREINSTFPTFAARMLQSIRLANRRIFNTTLEDASKRGMGTTVVAIALSENLSCIVHVGDSRAYRIRNNQIEQMTVDHSWLNELIQENEISAEEAVSFSRRNVITRALGIKDTVEVDLRVDVVENNDYFLLCSDGLSGVIEDVRLKETILGFDNDLEGAVQTLVDTANEAGGPDNITVVLIKTIELDAGVTNKLSINQTIPDEDDKTLSAEDRMLKAIFGLEVSGSADERPTFIESFLGKLRS